VKRHAPIESSLHPANAGLKDEAVESRVADPLFQTLDTRYGRFTVFSNDSGAVGQSLVRYGEWAENELAFLRALIGEGVTVLDVGAYIGTHALAFSRFVGPSGNVVCIEPQTRAFDLLKANIEANGLKNVQLENAVASFALGSVVIPSIEIETPASYASASLLQALSPELNGPGTITSALGPNEMKVPAISIDSLNLASCALIKIDAEGMEYLVLRGAPLTIKRCSPIIYAECNSLENGLKTYALMKAAGYEVRAHVVAAFNPDNFRGTRKDIFNGGHEVALVGVPGAALSRIERYPIRSCELLLTIDTADDLALAMLNKPQYVTEVLRLGLAAQSGGNRWIDEADGNRIVAQRLRNAKGKLRSLWPLIRQNTKDT
jgi:FkbM family methyltransferase